MSAPMVLRLLHARAALLGFDLAQDETPLEPVILTRRNGGDFPASGWRFSMLEEVDAFLRGWEARG